MTVKERVQKGIELLDKEIGSSWIDKVDLGLLDLGSCTECVLGQLFGRYMEGCTQLGLRFMEEIVSPGGEYGFDITEAQYDATHVDGLFKILNDEWVARIKDLKNSRKGFQLFSGR